MGTARLTDHGNLALFHRHCGLDREHGTGQCRGGRNTAALFQVFQGIQYRQKSNFSLFPVQLVRNFLGAEALLCQLKATHQHQTLAQGHIQAVHHIDFPLKFVCADTGALVSAGQLGGHGNGYHFVAIGRQFFKNFFKFRRRCLAGGRQFVAGRQLFIKLQIPQSHRIQIFLLAEEHLQRKMGHAQCLCLFQRQIRRRIHKKFHTHLALAAFHHCCI